MKRNSLRFATIFSYSKPISGQKVEFKMYLTGITLALSLTAKNVKQASEQKKTNNTLLLIHFYLTVLSEAITR